MTSRPSIEAYANPLSPYVNCAAYGHFVPCYMGGMTGYGEFIEYPEIRDWVCRMTPLVYSPKPSWPACLVRRDPEALSASFR